MLEEITGGVSRMLVDNSLESHKPVERGGLRPCSDPAPVGMVRVQPGAAHKRGVAIGRPRALTPEQILMAEAMTADPAISTRQVAEQFGIHRSTLYRHLNARQKRSA